MAMVKAKKSPAYKITTEISSCSFVCREYCFLQAVTHSKGVKYHYSPTLSK